MKPVLRIRLAQPADAKAMLNIYSWYIQNTVTSFEIEVPLEEAYSQRIIAYSSEAPWLVAENKGAIIGFAYASPHRGRAAYQWNREVSIYLEKLYHGQGVARQLYQTLFELLKIQGYANVLAGIVTPNPQSERFHQKMGFQRVGTYHRIGFKHNRWQDVSWYELFLQKTDFVPSTVLTMDELKNQSAFQKLVYL